MIGRRAFLIGLAATLAEPIQAHALTPLDLDAALKPFSVDPLPGLDAVAVPTIETFRGQVSVLNAWASWCAACQQEHGLLKELKDKGVRLVGINVDDKDEAALRYLQKQGNPFTFVGADHQSEVKHMLGIRTLPQTFLIGPDTRIAWQTSERLDDELVAQLHRVIDGLKA